MNNRKAFSAAAALAVAAGILLVPAGAFARGGGGFAAGARGPVFGFHPHFAHRPFRPALVRRFPARFGWNARWWNLHRFGSRNRAGASAAYPLAGDGGYGAPYDPNDLTGTVAAPGPAAVLVPPPAAPFPPEHEGCLSRGYDVPGESGGVTRVVVTRC